MAEAVAPANAPGYGLSSSIYTSDPKEAFAFRRGVSAGMVSVNNSTSDAEGHQLTCWQALNWDHSGRLQKAQMDVVELTPDREFRL
jgi:alpha-ketoglutaric semialdehyde dehydrogenase